MCIGGLADEEGAKDHGRRGICSLLISHTEVPFSHLHLGVVGGLRDEDAGVEREEGLSLPRL